MDSGKSLEIILENQIIPRLQATILSDLPRLFSMDGQRITLRIDSIILEAAKSLLSHARAETLSDLGSGLTAIFFFHVLRAVNASLGPECNHIFGLARFPDSEALRIISAPREGIREIIETLESRGEYIVFAKITQDAENGDAVTAKIVYSEDELKDLLDIL